MITLDITYYLKKDKFVVGGTASRGGQVEIVQEFLRRQIGTGRDRHKRINRDTYHIRLNCYPEQEDRIVALDDTGNAALRDGILLKFLGTLR